MPSQASRDPQRDKLSRRNVFQLLGLTAGTASIAGLRAHAQQGEAAVSQEGPRMKWAKTYTRSGPFKTIATNHLSYSVPDFEKARDWYIDLLGMEDVFDTGATCALRFGIPWNHIYLARSNGAKPAIGHKSYSV